MFLCIAMLVMRKDFAIEIKSREILYIMLLFALLCVLVFLIVFVKEGEPFEDAVVGILWIAVAFAGTLALGRTFERERYGEMLRALLLVSALCAAIYVGKMLGIVVLLAVVELLLVFLVAILFHAALFVQPLLLAVLLILGMLGFSAVGAFFAAMLVRARMRDVMLPILLYPMMVPVMIAGVRGMLAVLQSPADMASAVMWIALLASFDVVFVTLVLWTFEPVMTE